MSLAISFSSKMGCNLANSSGIPFRDESHPVSAGYFKVFTAVKKKTEAFFKVL